MKIGQIAPLMESVPPRMYGGTTERIVSYLTEELVRMGHEVMLFASGNSITSAQLVGCVPTAIRLNSGLSFAHQTTFAAPGWRSGPQRSAPDHEIGSELIVASCCARPGVMPS